jgi:hypothetical protein
MLKLTLPYSYLASGVTYTMPSKEFRKKAKLIVNSLDFGSTNTLLLSVMHDSHETLTIIISILVLLGFLTVQCTYTCVFSSCCFEILAKPPCGLPSFRLRQSALQISTLKRVSQPSDMVGPLTCMNH